MDPSSCLHYASPQGELDIELFQHSGDCIKILDLDGRVRQLNPGGAVALELAEPAQLLGQVWWDIWPAASRSAAQAAFTSARNGTLTKFHAWCPTVRGTSRWWDVVATPVRDEGGAVKQVMVVSRDVSELVLAREALKDADRRKDDFLTLVAHELRNPISAGNTICELLKLKPLEHARTAELAARIQRQFLHMSRVAEDLLDVSRIRRGEIHLDLRPLDAALVVHEALDQLQPAIAARRHQVALDLPEHPCLVDGDHFRLVQVVGNLLGNAVRYTGEGGAIRLELVQHDGVVQLSVADNGVGMAPDCIAGIFDLYAQLDSSDGRRHHGLGLGLPLVRAIVALHGGTVTASSPGEGLGSVFVVALPAARQAAP